MAVKTESTHVLLMRFIAAWVLSVICGDYRSQPYHPHLSLAAAAAATVAAMAAVVGATAATDVDGPLRYNVLEEVEHGTVIGDLTLDAGLRRRYTDEILAVLEFRIMSPPPLPFVVDLKTGVIRTGGVIDRDSLMQCKDKNLCEVTLDVTVRPTQFFQIIKVTIQVDDINDNAPYFRDQRMTISIRESAALGTSFSLPLASDLDSPTFGVQAYELTTETNSLGLSVMVRGGGLLEARLIVQQELDRETRDNYRLQLVAYDGGRPPKSASLDITVHVLDSNDHSPVFDRPSYASNLTENTPVGTVITRVAATDRDIGINAEVVYGFSQQTQTMYGHLFGINNKTGEIAVLGEIDYEQSSVYQLAVIAEDLGPDSMPTDAAVVIRVQDINDNVPTIVVSTLTARKTDTAEVSENLAPGTFVAHISVLDRDSGDNGRVSCNISDPVFSLVERYPTELQVLTSVTLDRETEDHYDVWVVCWDGGIPPLVARKLLPVKILDANDQAPRFSTSTYSGKVVENSQLDQPILHVKATDADIGTNADLHYVLSPGVVSSFDVNADGAIVAKTPIDREQFSSFSFTVLAIDHGTPSLTGTALVLIIVEDVNDELPVFSRSSYSFSVSENEPEGTAVGTVSAEDMDVPPQNTVRYSFSGGHLTHNKFAIAPESGDIFTTASLDREVESVYRFTVLASDLGKPPLTGTATVTVYVQDRNDHDPVFQFPTLSNNTVRISNALPLGHVVTQVVAIDPDLDKNGRVVYQLQAGNENGAFTVDPQRGLVTLNVRLNHLDFHEFHLIVVASDGATPRRSTQGLLRIQVNSSIAYVAPPSDDYADPDAAGQNLVIVVLLVCGSAVATVTLSILIVVVWRRSYRRKKSQRYKCRMEALRALTAKELVVSATCGEITPLTTSVTPFNGRPQRTANNGALANGSSSAGGALYQTKAVRTIYLFSSMQSSCHVCMSTIIRIYVGVFVRGRAKP